jgi:hypothetical protein
MTHIYLSMRPTYFAYGYFILVIFIYVVLFLYLFVSTPHPLFYMRESTLFHDTKIITDPTMNEKIFTRIYQLHI